MKNKAFNRRKFRYASTSVLLTALIVAAIIVFNIIFSALGSKCYFSGQGRLPQRPLTPLINEMTEHGVQFSAETLPFHISGTLNSGCFNIFSLPTTFIFLFIKFFSIFFNLFFVHSTAHNSIRHLQYLFEFVDNGAAF